MYTPWGRFVCHLLLYFKFYVLRKNCQSRAPLILLRYTPTLPSYLLLELFSSHLTYHPLAKLLYFLYTWQTKRPLGLRSSDPKDKTVHMKCAVSPTFRPTTQAWDAVSHSATSLRKQNSKLPFKLPTPDTGQRTGM